MATQINLTTGTLTTEITLSTGARGPQGVTEITTDTDTDITGILKGDGSTVSAATANSDYQGVPEVKSASFTAENNGSYVVVASATVTDPSPVAGEGFAVFVRNGTATVGGTAYASAGTVIRRVYHSGAWANYVFQDKTTADAAYAAASHTHVSADITDATDDGYTNPQKVLKTDAGGDITIGGITLKSSLAFSDALNSFLQGISPSGTNSTFTLPTASGTGALTGQADGTIRATDLDFANTTDIGAALADADEIMISDGGGNTTRRKTLLSRIWTYIDSKLNAYTAAGAWAFSSTTRPTSAGTGTPAATSLITRDDARASFAHWVNSVTFHHNTTTGWNTAVSGTGAISAYAGQMLFQSGTTGGSGDVTAMPNGGFPLAGESGTFGGIDFSKEFWIACNMATTSRYEISKCSVAYGITTATHSAGVSAMTPSSGAYYVAVVIDTSGNVTLQVCDNTTKTTSSTLSTVPDVTAWSRSYLIRVTGGTAYLYDSTGLLGSTTGAPTTSVATTSGGFFFAASSNAAATTAQHVIYMNAPKIAWK